MSGGLVGGIFNAVGTAVNNLYGRWTNERDFGYQKDLNNNSIAWRVADAQRAGIHPLYALGPTGATFSPVSTNFQNDGGQDLTRAWMANMDRRQREQEMEMLALRAKNEDARETARTTAEVAHLNAQTEYIRNQIGRLNSAQLGPGTPSVDGPRRVRVVPSEVTAATSDEGPRQAGIAPDYQYFRNRQGGYVPRPSNDVASRDMDGNPQGFEWWLQNSFLPRFTQNGPPPPHPARPGYEWFFAADGAWYERRIRGRDNPPASRRPRLGIIN